MNNMDKELKNLIRKDMARDIEIKMLNKKLEGMIISEEIILEILKECYE